MYVDKGHALQSIYPLSVQLTNVMFSVATSGSLSNCSWPQYTWHHQPLKYPTLLLAYYIRQTCSPHGLVCIHRSYICTYNRGIATGPWTSFIIHPADQLAQHLTMCCSEC
jgi:hypothetical protein